jgi:prepilin-type N-terminal cleavage/methylation domain-containing protein
MDVNHRDKCQGFTLIELMIILTVLGIVLAFSVPAFVNLSGSQKLKGATENVVGQLRLAREKAVATGIAQPVHFVGTTTYQIQFGAIVPSGAQWTLPRNVSFGRAMDDWYTLTADGRVKQAGNADGIIPFADSRGNKDTVTVESSGTVLAN